MNILKELDPMLHSRMRLAIVCLLVSENECEFNYLMDKTKASSGNVSVQINKLKKARYITVVKRFRDNKPQTLCRITDAGLDAFNGYAKNLQDYLNVKAA